MGEIRFPGWDPVLFHVWGPIDCRYYGLMYIVGFVCGHVILTRLARRKFLPMPETAVGDLLFYLILGVVLGGRIGYSLFYKPEFFKNPLEIFKLWEGGLSFHGGLIGVAIAFMWFSRKHKLPAWRLCDAMALAVTPGIFAVRMANFINGELYGRIIKNADEAVPWAMRFPTDPVASRLLGLSGDKRLVEKKIYYSMHPESAEGWWKDSPEWAEIAKTPKWETVAPNVDLRHPSQIYEGLAEGLILGLILLFAYRRTCKKPLGTGAYGGIFLIGYGVMRFYIEYFREPDAHLGPVLWHFSMGQVLCFAMVAIGIAMITLRWNKRLAEPVDEEPTEGAAA